MAKKKWLSVHGAPILPAAHAPAITAANRPAGGGASSRSRPRCACVTPRRDTGTTSIAAGSRVIGRRAALLQTADQLWQQSDVALNPSTSFPRARYSLIRTKTDNFLKLLKETP
jgi:hypothetical protein